VRGPRMVEFKVFHPRTTSSRLTTRGPREPGSRWRVRG
jgi:hypothetical protein